LGVGMEGAIFRSWEDLGWSGGSWWWDVNGQRHGGAAAGALDGGGEAPSSSQGEQAPLAEPAAVRGLGQLEAGGADLGGGLGRAGQLDPLGGQDAAAVEVGH